MNGRVGQLSSAAVFFRTWFMLNHATLGNLWVVSLKSRIRPEYFTLSAPEISLAMSSESSQKIYQPAALHQCQQAGLISLLVALWLMKQDTLTRRTVEHSVSF
jgi:hypothetical protein